MNFALRRHWNGIAISSPDCQDYQDVESVGCRCLPPRNSQFVAAGAKMKVAERGNGDEKN